MTKTWNGHKLEIREDHFGWNYCNGVQGCDRINSIINWYIHQYKLDVDKVALSKNSSHFRKLKAKLTQKFSIL